MGMEEQKMHHHHDLMIHTVYVTVIAGEDVHLRVLKLPQ